MGSEDSWGYCHSLCQEGIGTGHSPAALGARPVLFIQTWLPSLLGLPRGSVDLTEPCCLASPQRKTQHILCLKALPGGYIPGRPPSTQETPSQNPASSAEKSPLLLRHHTTQTSKATEQRCFPVLNYLFTSPPPQLSISSGWSCLQ